MERPWQLYLLRCGDGTLYTGIALDAKKRFLAHQRGKGAKYTRGRGPLKLVYTESCPSHSEALKRELEVKAMSREEKEKLIACGSRQWPVFYHAVTERPMEMGQIILFAQDHHNGVYQRVMEKAQIVQAILANPEDYSGELEHHTAVALRELAMEQERRESFPDYPSRMSCLYVSRTLEEARQWGAFFARIGRPTYSIVKLECRGSVFLGDAEKCFTGVPDGEKNKALARTYWMHNQEETPADVCEVLVDGEITVLEIVEELSAYK